MKIIDLLNKIANGEETPNKIKYKNKIYEYREQENSYYDGLYYLHFNSFLDYLNEEIEIIEENKIEKINIKAPTNHMQYMQNKINEIIDKINEMSDNND